MHKVLRSGLLAGAVAMAAVSVPLAPAAAQYADSGVSFRYFRDQLAPYGDWFYSDRWGEVWSPNVDASFQPYSNGYWVYTDEYGWLWSSNEPWADIAYHFGRWVNDPYDGWLWIPGYVWGPAWVVWRGNGDYTGWAPMPPSRGFLEGDESDFDVGDSGMYGYDQFYGSGYRGFATSWVFVDNRHFGERNIFRFAVRDHARVIDLVRRTRNVRTYRIVNNRVFNGGIGIQAFARARGVPIVPVPAARFVRRPSLIVDVNVGRQIQLRMRQQLPRGTGRPNSAPQLTPDRMHILGTRNADRPQRLRERPPRPDAPATGAPPLGRPGANAPAMPGRPGRPVPPSTAVEPPENAPQRNPADRPGRLDRRPSAPGENPSGPASPQPEQGAAPSRPTSLPSPEGPPARSRENRVNRDVNAPPPDMDSGMQPSRPVPAPSPDGPPARSRENRGNRDVNAPPDMGSGAQPPSPGEPPHMRRSRPQPPQGDNGAAPPPPAQSPAGSAPKQPPARPRPSTPQDNPSAGPGEEQGTQAPPPRRKRPRDESEPPGTPQ